MLPTGTRWPFFNDMAMITAILIYLIGAFLCYCMQRIEHEAENQTYTKGDRLLNVCLSLFSFLWIIVILVTSWVKKISATGYWNRPVKEQPVPETVNKAA